MRSTYVRMYLLKWCICLDSTRLWCLVRESPSNSSYSISMLFCLALIVSASKCFPLSRLWLSVLRSSMEPLNPSTSSSTASCFFSRACSHGALRSEHDIVGANIALIDSLSAAWTDALAVSLTCVLWFQYKCAPFSFLKQFFTIHILLSKFYQKAIVVKFHWTDIQQNG